jgi:hypothetical protein
MKSSRAIELLGEIVILAVRIATRDQPDNSNYLGKLEEVRDWLHAVDYNTSGVGSRLDQSRRPD